MNCIRYDPITDSLIFNPEEISGKPSVRVGHYDLWFGKGIIKALRIRSYLNESADFIRGRKSAALEGLLRGIRITDAVIDVARRDLLNQLENRWECPS
jgi:hypothetical protein